jgi:CHAT domain-containing protein
MLYFDKSGKEDASFMSSEIYNIKLNADLVSLSACQTGLGKISRGEGIIGLTRALLYAGAKNVAVSLWKVGDASTSRLMIDFYTPFLSSHNTTENQSYSTFLQQAKLKMIADHTYAAPFYWSPFVLIGR